MRRYDDSLEIGEAAPVIAYVMSSPTTSRILRESLPAFARAIEARLSESGVIRVTKDTGLFLAERGYD